MFCSKAITSFLATVTGILFFSVSLCTAQEIVFDNGVGGAAGINDGLQSDADPLPENNNSIEIAADNFSVTRDTEITNVEWAGVYVINNSPGVDEFVIRIYADNGGPSGAPIAEFEVGNNVNRSDSGVDFMFLFDIYEYSADISFAASANTTYWVSIDAQSFSNVNNTWFWGSQSDTGDAHISEDVGATWNLFGQTTAFVLFGSESAGILGDINCDGSIDLLDVQPFVDLLTTGGFSDKADFNTDGKVNLLDVDPFVALLTGN